MNDKRQKCSSWNIKSGMSCSSHPPKGSIHIALEERESPFLGQVTVLPALMARNNGFSGLQRQSHNHATSPPLFDAGYYNNIPLFCTLGHLGLLHVQST